MYKVFVNDKLVKLIDNYSDYASDDYTLFMKFYSKESIVFAIKLLMSNKNMKQLVIYHDDLEKLWGNFKSLYSYMITGGGVVRNEKGEYLFIFKRGKWDLPKGKVNDGEAPKEAAIREVGEEAGVNNLEVLRDLGVTHHIFEEGNDTVLKRTHWYEMKTDFKGDFKVDKKEGIEKAAWLDKAGRAEAFRNTYPSIIEICEGSLSL